MKLLFAKFPSDGLKDILYRMAMHQRTGRADREKAEATEAGAEKSPALPTGLEEF